jgi:ATP synthase F1 gamma subunit
MTEQAPAAYAGKRRVLSGVKPTGDLHLGNYLGALVKFTRMQHEMETFIFVADLHAITEWQEPAKLAAQATTAGPAAAYDYEPDENEILATLLPRNISVQVFRALLENAASEQGARMSAMDNATRNAGDMIRKQTQIYNRSRQAMITKELIEIISGAEAL